MPTRITGLRITLSGRNGSGAWRSHHTKASAERERDREQHDDRRREPRHARAARGERDQEHGRGRDHQHGADEVEPVRAVVARQPLHRAMRPAAPRASPSGTLSQKITDQCRCSAMMPPSAGPATPATIQDGAHIGLVAAALARRDHVGDGGLRRAARCRRRRCPAACGPAISIAMLGASRRSAPSRRRTGRSPPASWRAGRGCRRACRRAATPRSRTADRR